MIIAFGGHVMYHVTYYTEGAKGKFCTMTDCTLFYSRVSDMHGQLLKLKNEVRTLVKTTKTKGLILSTNHNNAMPCIDGS